MRETSNQDNISVIFMYIFKLNSKHRRTHVLEDKITIAEREKSNPSFICTSFLMTKFMLQSP